MGNRGGRPSKFTKATRTKIYKAIREGCSYKVAALAAGVVYDTFNEWRKQGDADRVAGLDSEFSEFSEQLELAEAAGEAERAAQIGKAGRGGSKVIQTKTVTKRVAVLPPKPKQGKRGKDDGEAEALLTEVLGQPVEALDDEAGETPGGLPPLALVVVEEVTTRVEATLRPDWKAAAWMLERRNRERWGRDAEPEETHDALPDALLTALEQVYGGAEGDDGAAAAPGAPDAAGGADS